MKRTREGKTRREFLGRSVAAGMALGLGARGIPAATAAGANERIRVGFIGVGNRGTKLLKRFLAFDHVEVAALCDVYEPYLSRERAKVAKWIYDELGPSAPPMDEKLKEPVARYRDFRKLLDQRDIDAVVIGTPDHWHAIQTIQACEAGKDVYVEKPLTMTIVEGRRIVEAAKRQGRIVQVGLQRRSSEVYRKLVEKVSAGRVGRITTARAYRISNMHPRGIGKAKDSDPPEGFDWNLWLGPRAWRPFRTTIAPYRFRWWKDYSSQVANWGVHYFDTMRWLMGEEAPVSVSAHGGRYAVDDDRTIPDTLEVTFEFASGRLVIFGQYEASGGSALRSGEIEFRGTLGNLYASDWGYHIVPSAGGQFQERTRYTDEANVRGTGGVNAVAEHVRDFLECVRTRRTPRCDAETGHRSTTFALLANIALETRSRIERDPAQERITSPAGTDRLLHYDYRQPWSLA